MNIYIVDDDEALRTVASLILRQSGHEVETFACGEAFLEVAHGLTPGCVLLDLCLPDMDGLQVQQFLNQSDCRHAVVFISGVGDVPDAVTAMRAGALDFLRKPCSRKDLLEAADRARDKLAEQTGLPDAPDMSALLDKLTRREREVLAACAGGAASKSAAFTLGLSVRTIEMHRSNILRKLNVPSFSVALLAAQGGGLIVNPRLRTTTEIVAASPPDTA